MEVMVIEKFRDKYTNEVYKKGSIIEVTEARFKEIQEVGNFLEKLRGTKKTRTAKQVI